MTDTTPLQQWEYKIVSLKSEKKWFGLYGFITEEHVSELLAGLGSLGWECISERPAGMELKYIFKRPKTGDNK